MVVGVRVSVLKSRVVFRPAKISLLSLNHLKLAGGFAFTTHFKLVVWLSQDFTSISEEEEVSTKGRSENK